MMYNLDVRKILGTIIGIIIFACGVLFFTYAWHEWRSENTDVDMEIQDVVIEFESGSDISVNNMGPVFSYQDGVKSEFKAINGGSGESSFYVYLNIESISDMLLTEGFKYVLVRDVNGGNNYDYKNPVVTGDFSEFHVGTNVITSTETIRGVLKDTEGEVVYSYQFIVYIDGNIANNIDIQGNSMFANLVVSGT